jgi:DNA polymerase-3 subunit delta'
MSTYDDNWGMIGHEWAVDLLASRLAGDRAGHAYLFTGPSQIGKSTLAIRFAQAMNCTDPVDGGSPCGQCRACDLIGRGVHPDVQVVTAEGKSIKIEAIRELHQSLALRPYEARFRVAILPDMQLATDHAADALLKTLEEPPASTRLLLTSDVSESLLPTIVSRCQVIPLRPVSIDTLADALIHRHGLDGREAAMLAALSGGRPGWALSAIENPDLLKNRTEIVNALLAVLNEKRVGRFNYSEEIARHAELQLILETWQSWWRDVLLLVEGSSVTPVNVDRREDLEALSLQVTPEEARRALMAVRRTIEALGKNANTRLALDVMLLEMPYLMIGHYPK